MSTYNTRLTILDQSEITALYSLPKLSAAQQRFYFELNDAEWATCRRLNTKQAQVYFILLLGYFKYKPVPLDFKVTEAKDDIDYILKTLLPGKKLALRGLPTVLKTRLYKRIYQLTGYQPISAKLHIGLQQKAMDVARIYVEPRYIFDECLEYLGFHKAALPKYSTLQKVVVTALSQENERIDEVLSAHLTADLSKHFQAMIASNVSNKSNSLLTSLKTLPKDFTNKEISKEIATFEYLKPLYPAIVKLVGALDLSSKNVEYYASLVDYYTITKLRRFGRNTAALYIACYIFHRYRQINDNLINALIYHVRKLTSEATTYAKAKAFEAIKDITAKVKNASGILRLFIDEKIADDTPFSRVRKKAFSLVPKKDISVVSNYLADIQVDIEHYEWQFYDENAERIQNNIRRLFCALEFQGREDQVALIEQINRSQEELQKYRHLQTFDKRLIKKSYRPYVLAEDPKDPSSTQINRSRCEVLLYRMVKTALEDWDISVPNSQQYMRIEDDLVDDETWRERETLIAACGLPKLQRPIETQWEELCERLEAKLTEVSQRIVSGQNQVVVMTDRSGKHKWRLPYKSVGVAVNNPYFERLPPVGIGELMAFVNQDTDFLSAFTHIQPRYQKNSADLSNIIACVVANGTNFGLHKMASISDRSLDQLRSTQANFLRLETLHAAIDAISNRIVKLPIFRYYNIQEEVIHASADGQKFESRLSSFKTRYSSKYFGKNKGVSSMTLVANHVPVNARLIGSNEHESHYVFDLLYNNTSEIRPDVLSTDSHGSNHVNFALLDLFGYTFAPRYANFSKIIRELFTVSEDGSQRLLNLRHPPRKHDVIEGWDMVQRIAISLQKKKTTQAILVRKLSGYKRSSTVLQALVEYDRLIKCLYVLDYIDDASLRQYVQRALNRGEAYHQLRRAVASVNGNRFRGGSDQEILLWNECARLVTNCIIYFNSLLLSGLLQKFEKEEDDDNRELVKRLSPVAWLNINLNGTYQFALQGQELNLDALILEITG